MQELHPLFKKVKERIEAAASIAVIMHQNPDGDAVGSLLGLGHYLRANNVNHILFCTTPIPEYLKFLNGVEFISTDHAALTEREFDVVIVLDSGDLEYAGVAEHFRRLKGIPVVINIDHHASNAHYGHVNVVNPQASSTAEIIFHFFDYTRHPITKEVATSLLTGILTDTGSFSNMGTTPSSLDVSSRLLAYGARVKEIVSHTLRNKSLNQLQLWGRALSRLKQDPKTGIVTTVLTKHDFDELGMEESSEGIANFLNSVEDAKAVMVLYEKGDGIVKASLRTTQPDVDVSKMAKHFGGGGHKKAAGFSVRGTLVETDQGWRIVEEH